MGDPDPLIGRQLGSFRIDRILGRGGMATVYYGWDTKLDRPVAIKVIDPYYQGDPAYARRFINEARAVATWRHPNVLQVYSADDEDGLYYFVMEFVSGTDLGVLLDQTHRAGRRLPVAEVLRIGRAVAEALDYAHERGIIHRDVKPSNVMVAEDGRVALADFGISVNLAQGTMGTVFGSPHYFAPEQARNSATVVAQSDLYSLAVMLYEMLAGRVPFSDPEPLALAMMHIEQTPPSPRLFNPSLSTATETVLLKALQKRPQDRYQTGRELILALEKALDAPPPTMPLLDGQALPAGPSASAPPARVEAVPILAAAQVAAVRVVRALEPVKGAAVQGVRAAAPAAAAAGRAASRAFNSLRQRVAVGLPVIRQRAEHSAFVQRLRQDPAARWRAGGVVLLLAAILAFAAFSLRPGSNAATARPSASAAIDDTQAAADALTAGAPTPGDAPPEATDVPASDATTVAPGAGDHFALYYDDTGLYFKNLSDHDRPISPFAFERLDAAGNPANRWDGSHWSEIYPTFRAGRCLVIELIDYKSHLKPKECANKHLVFRSPFAGDPYIFWTTQAGSTQFRVLWDNNEVGRCDIAAKSCDFYVP